LDNEFDPARSVRRARVDRPCRSCLPGQPARLVRKRRPLMRQHVGGPRQLRLCGPEHGFRACWVLLCRGAGRHSPYGPRAVAVTIRRLFATLWKVERRFSRCAGFSWFNLAIKLRREMGAGRKPRFGDGNWALRRFFTAAPGQVVARAGGGRNFFRNAPWLGAAVLLACSCCRSRSHVFGRDGIPLPELWSRAEPLGPLALAGDDGERRPKSCAGGDAVRYRFRPHSGKSAASARLQARRQERCWMIILPQCV